MNLHSIAAPVVGAVNINQRVTLLQNTGFVTNPDFSRSPAYVAYTMPAQIQGLTSDSIRVLSGVGIQGDLRRVYLWGTWTSLVRSLQKGNDLMILPDRSMWKVVLVFEDFGHELTSATGWCSVAIRLQNQPSEDYVIPVLSPFYVSFAGQPSMAPSDWDGNLELADIQVPVSVTLPVNLTTSPTPGCDLTATSDLVITIQHIADDVPTSIGSVVIPAGSTVGTYSLPTERVIPAGDRIRIFAPPTAPPNVGDVWGTIVGTRLTTWP